MFDKKKWIQSGAMIQIPNASSPSYILGTPCDKQTGASFYTPYFFESQNSFWNSEIVQEENLIHFLEDECEDWNFSKWKEPSFQDFKERFMDFQNQARKNVLKKVVPVFFASSSRNSFNEKQKLFLLKNLLQKKEGFVYGMWNSKEGILGCTPEYLFSQKSSTLSTLALAGTARDQNHSLMQDSKEVNEHQIVSRFIDDQWKEENSIQKSQMYEWNFGTLKHLRTDFIIQLRKNFSFLEIIEKMHPTPALGGFPKKEAMDWLKWSEKKSSIKRKRFGAPFGIKLSAKEGFCLVAIRNIQWNQDHFFLGSGFGLTQESQLEREWLELKLKRESALRFLNP